MYNKVWVLPFEPQKGATVRLTVTATTVTSGRQFSTTDQNLTGGSPYSQGRRDLCVRVVNPTALKVRMDFGATATSASATAGFTMLPNTMEIFSSVRGAYVVASATGAATIELTPGEGI